MRLNRLHLAPSLLISSLLLASPSITLEKSGARFEQIEREFDALQVVESQLEVENSSISRHQTLLILHRSENCWAPISLKSGRRNWQVLTREASQRKLRLDSKRKCTMPCSSISPHGNSRRTSK